MEIGATFRSQAEVNFGGYCAATSPSELVYFYIGTYGAELMTLAPATGRVGIGTTSPQSHLEVYKQSAFISLQQPLPGLNGIKFGDGGITRGQIADEEDNAARALIKKPVSAYVEQVYQYGDFSLLGLGDD